MAKYRILPDRSTLTVEARSNVHPIRIRTPGFEGTIETETQGDKLKLSNPARARLQIAAELMKSGIELYDAEIQRMIETRKFSQIKGELLRVEEKGQGSYCLRGRLSFHGVTKEIESNVTVRVSDGDTLEVEGEHTIDMRDFNLQPPKILMLQVLPEVSVRAKITAVREA